MKAKLVCFDCDGVLIIGDPWINLHRALGIPKEQDMQWFRDYYSGKLKFVDWNDRLQRMYIEKGLTKTLFEDILQSFTINAEADDLLRFLQKQELKVAIVSSGIDFYVKKAAEKLGITTWKANYSFVFDEVGKFVHMNYLTDDPTAKTLHVTELCQTDGINPTNETIFVGDSINDVAVFEFTKHGVLYKAKTQELLKVSWREIENLSELKNLIYS